ncbi:MAG: MCE family protein [Alphaproteobacteria bacterium]|nr:MCE family protein [Alphaproteobacteria bacterium]
MNTGKINYVAVGLFVTAAFVGLMASIAMLSGRTGSTDAYYSVYRNVTGVKFGTQVLYEGYPIGQVEQVTPVAKGGAMMFRVDYEVTEGWKIPDNSIARIGASGLLSAITINIDAGDSPIAHKPGTLVKGVEASDLFSVMSDMAGEVSNIAENDIRPLLATINATADAFAKTVSTVGELVDDDGKRIVKTLSQIADDLNQRMPRIAENLDASTAHFATLTKDLNDTRDNLDKLLVASEGMVSENRTEVRKSIEDLKHVTDSLARHIDSVNQNVEGTARNMYEFSREIRQNPGLLLTGTTPQDKTKK